MYMPTYIVYIFFSNRLSETFEQNMENETQVL